MATHAREFRNENLLINLPIVHIDPNSRRQPHQPIVIRGAARALATAICLPLVVVERGIHECTTKQNVDNLFSFCFYHFRLNKLLHPRQWIAVGVHKRKARHNEIFLHFLNPFLSYRFYCAINNFCHLKLFNLSSFPLSFSQLLFCYHILNSPNETFFFFLLFAIVRTRFKDKLF